MRETNTPHCKLVFKCWNSIRSKPSCNDLRVYWRGKGGQTRKGGQMTGEERGRGQTSVGVDRTMRGARIRVHQTVYKRTGRTRPVKQEKNISTLCKVKIDALVPCYNFRVFLNLFCQKRVGAQNIALPTISHPPGLQVVYLHLLLFAWDKIWNSVH